ncbi:MAG: acyl-CoA dehydrogenase family protein [Gemmatimonadaceae bacterium]|nr:acyl-CoA dehydrogenase family protein [Gemmatimonadaceae bacterium]
MADQSHALASEQEARDVAEDARESEWAHPSFVKELFLGRFRPELIHPFPASDNADAADAKVFLGKLAEFLGRYDADMVDRTGDIPEAYVQELREIGAFGIKIPKEYGGLGLSQMTYVKAMELVTAKCGSLCALLSASQSIGVPQPLKLFGTDEQKKEFFPRIAKGGITAFALTEVNAGSDPANMSTTATPSEDGTHWVLNGEKLWCTNGTRADLFVVMARTPDRMVNGRLRKKQITAFIVDAKSAGISIKHRCRFMGLKAIENGWLSFENVKVPSKNILWGEGKGLKLALITLNTGRLTIPASVAGATKALLNGVRQWANERVQWGQPIAKHEAIAQKIARLGASAFAMESVAYLSTALYERGGTDIRLEAAIAKMFNTELAWHSVDDALQIRGGRGYETADSLRARGETPFPVERAMRDSRINLIFEGSSEIMRLFIAREAVDAHFSIAFPIVDPKSSFGTRVKYLLKAAPFYATWYPARWIPSLGLYGEFGRNAKHARYVARATNRLGRALFHAMLRFGPALEKRQMVLFRAVDIGAELYAMSATLSRAQMLAKEGNKEALALADAFCRESRDRIEASFRNLFGKHDPTLYKLAQAIVRGEHAWLERGVVEPTPYEQMLEPVPASAEPAREVASV